MRRIATEVHFADSFFWKPVSYVLERDFLYSAGEGMLELSKRFAIVTKLMPSSFH